MQDPYAVEPMEEQFEPQDIGYGQVVPFPMMSPEQIAMIESAQKLRSRVVLLQRLSDIDNAADLLEPEQLSKIGGQVSRDYRIDLESRDEWEKRARRAMDLARQKKESKSFPWAGSSNVKYPMLTTAALQFAARAYPAIVDGPRIVKCQVKGKDDEQGSKAAAADRVSQHMSYQLLFELPEWEADMDTALHQIPIVGCAFKKVYPDPNRDAGFCSELVSAFDLVVNQRAKTLDTVPRVTHVFPLYPHEIGERQRSGRFLKDVDVKGSSEDGNDDDAPHIFLEQHRYLDLDDDGVMEPWIVTVHEKTEKVVRIKPCFDASKLDIDQQNGEIIRIPKKHYFVKIPFIPDPEGGFYDVGFGHLLEPLSDVIDTTINQMMDAGTLQNSGGGFIASGVTLGKGKSTITFKPGEYKTVQTPANDLRSGIVNMEHPGPSKTLFELLSLMIDSAKDIASIQDILVGDMPTNQTATATMATIEQGLKVFTAIYKRIYRALTVEYRMIFEINKTNAQLRMGKYVALMDEPVQVVQADYMGDLDVMPTADPNTITDMQRMSKAQIVLEEAKAGNATVNLFQATKRAFEAARVERIDELMIPPPEGPSEQEQITLAGLVAELEKVRADIEKTRAETEKTITEAVIARMGAMIPIGQPLPVAQPQFMPQQLDDGQMGQQQPPLDEMGMMGVDPMGGGMPPEMMGGMGDPMQMGMQPDAGMDEQAVFGMEQQGLSPELLDQIAAEQMAAGDAMPGDGMEPQ